VFICLASIGQVDQNEYGLVMNWVTKRIGDRVYRGGTHFIGFWNYFVRFPATVQTIEFSDRTLMHTSAMLKTRTKEGLALKLSIAFQYVLFPDDIPKLYALTNNNYEALFTRIARDQLLEAAAEYEGPQYWKERLKIGDHMRQLVTTHLNEQYASLWGLQLLRVELPDLFELSITQTQVQKQMAKTRVNEQVAASIRADTEVMTANYDKDMSIVKAAADANYTLVTKLAEAEAAKKKIAAEAEALTFAKGELKLSTVGAVQYGQLSAIGDLENATFLANVLGTTPVIKPVAAAAALVQKAEVQKAASGEAGADTDVGEGRSTAAADASAVSPSNSQRMLKYFLQRQTLALRAAD
jgi:regulator of protease activity HflC (stomatin/prohibitin superfamily)